jgi:hypothetical protein
MLMKHVHKFSRIFQLYHYDKIKKYISGSHGNHKGLSISYDKMRRIHHHLQLYMCIRISWW